MLYCKDNSIGERNMAEKIIGVYKITNTITGDFYIGSSKDVKQRWAVHKCQSTWKNHPNNTMYLDMQKYSVDKFELQILEEVESEHLKEKEQQFIETLKPTYNNYNAKGLNIERYKDYQKEYQKEYQKDYQKTDKYKEYMKEYHRKYDKEYHNQLCSYNGETLTLNALSQRFSKAGIEHPNIEAKKYIIIKESKNPIEFYDVYP